MKNRVCFVMLVGMPGCGKSTLAEKYKDKYKVISSDRIREELLGDIKDQKHNADVFKEMDARTIQCLKDGKNVIYDATNLRVDNRMKMLERINNEVETGADMDVFKECLVIVEPLSLCKPRTIKRGYEIPDGVYKHMLTTMDLPAYDEGWDQIAIKHPYFEFSTL